MKKIGVISTVGLPACYGGYESLVQNLVDYQESEEICYQVYCSSKSYTSKPRNYKQARLVYLPLKANGWQALIYDSFSLFHAYCTCDIILSLGTVGCFWLPIFKLFSKKKVIINLDGLDDKRDKWNKLAKFIIGSARNIAAKYADEIISDNKAIQDYVKELYDKKSNLIEYGGDNATPYYNKDELAEYGLIKSEYAFKVARIEPENNIDLILESFSEIPSLTLVLVGNWNKSQFGRDVKQKYSSYTNLVLLDPIYESEKINLLRSNCLFYVHGHSAGGTNPSLVEAMNLGLCILSYDVSYNRATTENKALYFSSKKELISQVQYCMLPQNQLKIKSIADSMKSIALKRYQWSIIATKYEDLFK